MKWKNEDDLEYLTKKIIDNVGTKDYKTNVKGKMTYYNFFLKNKRFHKILEKVLSEYSIGDDALGKTANVTLGEAWGAILDKDDYVKTHTHEIFGLVGVLYLTDDGEDLNFYKNHYQLDDNIVYSIKPERGLFVIFPGYVIHGTLKNYSEKRRICLPFNLAYIPNSKKTRLINLKQPY